MRFLAVFTLLFVTQTAFFTQTNCFTRSDPQLSRSNELTSLLIAAGIKVGAMEVSTFGELCFNEATQQEEGFTPLATDFDLRLPVERLTDEATLGNITATVLQLLTRFPPKQTPGPEPGEVTLTYVLGEAQNSVQFSVAEIAPLVNQSLSGAALMTALGYQPEQGPLVVQVAPSPMVLPRCNATAQSSLNIANASNLYAFDIELIYNPQLVQIIDANPQMEGVQVQPPAALSPEFIVINEADNQMGLMRFAAVLGDFNGDGVLAEIEWQIQGAGKSDLVLQRVELTNAQANPISSTNLDGLLEVSPVCDLVTGMVTLQGRNNHQGINITDALGQTTTTDASGQFSFFGGVSLTAQYAGYLSAVTDVTPTGNETPYNVGQVTLLAGDVTADNVINIFDLSYMANRYNGEDILSDFNQDGVVDIFDLSLAAGNYQRRGPLTEW